MAGRVLDPAVQRAFAIYRRAAAQKFIACGWKMYILGGRIARMTEAQQAAYYRQVQQLRDAVIRAEESTEWS
jgi:hypothetical protein